MTTPSSSSGPSSSGPSSSGNGKPCLLYCHCAYAKVVPAKVKAEVLQRLSDSGVAFDAVPDLCEMSARKDPALARFAGAGEMKIVACFDRAVRWLFHAAGTPLSETGVEVLNMREQTADEITEGVFGASATASRETTGKES